MWRRIEKVKIVQVPMGEKEAMELAQVAKELQISRADLIRKACAQYLRGLRETALDEEYARGYREIPEDSGFATVSAALVPPEDWPE